MGLLDKLLGRGKKAVGDMMGGASTRREDTQQAQGGTAEEPAAEYGQPREAGESAAEHYPERDDTSA